MKYSSLIDNVTSLRWGLTIQQAYVFEWIYSLPSWAEPAIIDGKEYFFASKTKALEELPLLTDKIDTMYRYYKSLEDCGLVIVKKVDGKDYLSLTEKAKEWGRKSDGSEINPSARKGSKLGKKSEKRSEINPTYKTTISDQITSNDDSIESSSEEQSKIPFGEAKAKVEESTKKKAANPVFVACVETWMKEVHPEWVSFSAVDGKSLKGLIVKMRKYSVAKNGGTEPTEERLIAFFKHYCKCLPDFYKSQTLSVLNSKFDSIIEEIKTQESKKVVGNATKANQMFGKYASR